MNEKIKEYNAFGNMPEEIDIWFSLMIVLKGDEDEDLSTL